MRLPDMMRWIIAASALLLLALAPACTPKKNTAATRNYQAFITRYNVYYNGDTHYKETLDEMERKYADDYSRMLIMHPAEARGREFVPQPSGSFTRSIEKAQKAIQLRSIKRRPRRQPGRRNDEAYQEWMKREEYNPFLHNAWMLLARSQFMNGDFLPAASTFLYITNHFRWLPATVTEARLWQARSYCAAGWLNEAMAAMARVKEKDLTTDNLRGLYAYVQADIALRRADYRGAVEPLETAARAARGAQRTRLNYLLGQVATAAGDMARARRAFSAVERAGSADYRTRFNARIRRSATGLTPAEAERELKALRRMARYDRNAEYLDQIFYARGNLLLARGDTAQAMHAYAEAVEKSTRGGIDKALAQLALGRLYFDRARYELAQPCYAEGVGLLPADFPGIDSLRARSDVLDALAVDSRLVQLNDSLLRLADMPEAERLAAVDAVIERLRRQEREAERQKEEEKRRQELEEQEEALRQQGGTNTQQGAAASAPTTFRLNTDDSWYFYNPQARQTGSAEFRRRWGNRKLEDDWRRRNKNSYTPIGADTDTIAAADSTATGAAAAPKAPADTAGTADPHRREFYLKDIPLDSASRAKAHASIQQGLYNMGLTLKDELGDFATARTHWSRLLRDYPDNVYRLDTYYNLYLMAARQGRMDEAEKWRRLIVEEFAESPQGVAMRSPDYFTDLRDMHARQEQRYEQAWQHYQANRNDSVRAAAAYAEEHYQMSPLLPKFMFLEALTYVTEGDTKGFTETLRKIVERFPDADVSPLAATWIRGAEQGRALAEGGTNARGRIWSTRLTNDSTATPAADTIAVTLEADAPRLVLLTFAADSVSANEVLFETARFNFNTFTVADFDLELLRFGPLGMVVVRPFVNLAEAERYIDRLDAEAAMMPPGVRAAIIPEADFRRLLTSGHSLEEYFGELERRIAGDVLDSMLPESPGEEDDPDEAGHTAEADDIDEPTYPTVP